MKGLVWPDFDRWHHMARDQNTQQLGEFLEWMNQNGIMRKVWWKDDANECGSSMCEEQHKCEGHYVNDHRTIEETICEFTGIDLKAYKDEADMTYQMVKRMVSAKS